MQQAIDEDETSNIYCENEIGRKKVQFTCLYTVSHGFKGGTPSATAASLCSYFEALGGIF